MPEPEPGSLFEFLRSRGVAEDEIERARAEGSPALELLAVDSLLFPGGERLTAPEIAERVGVDDEVARRFWRAVGFPDAGDDERAFTTADVEILRAALRIIELEIVDMDASIQQARVMGQAMSRVADAQVEWIRRRFDSLRETQDLQAATLGVIERLEQVMPLLESFLGYMWRRHLAAAVRRSLFFGDRSVEGEIPVGIGFADMVRFTRLTAELDEGELARTVDRFETMAYDTVHPLGGRIIKWIGDEVMFAAGQAAQSAEIALALADGYANDDTLPDVRIGVAFGPALAREGDYLGPTVNLAGRLVNLARPRTVVVSETIRDELEDDPRFVLRPMRPRALKGLGVVRAWVLRPGAAVDEPSEASAR